MPRPTVDTPEIDAQRGAEPSRPDVLDDLRCSVTFSRQHPKDCGQRQVFVKLDGQERITLNFGDTVTLDVMPGAHHIRVHNTLFWKNVNFSIEPGERLEFLIINSERWWTAGMVGILGSAPLFLTVKQISVR
jgi:hypothetical protein